MSTSFFFFISTSVQSNGQTYEETDAIPVFVGWLCDGKDDKVFEFLRLLKSRGQSSKEFLTRVVCALDEMYQYRREGENQCNEYTLQKTQHLQNEDIELLIELLTAGVDYSYVTTHVGVKTACVRALNYATSKKKST